MSPLLQFHYRSVTKYLKIPFRIVWGDQSVNALDNPHNIQGIIILAAPVTLYILCVDDITC